MLEKIEEITSSTPSFFLKCDGFEKLWDNSICLRIKQHQFINDFITRFKCLPKMFAHDSVATFSFEFHIKMHKRAKKNNLEKIWDYYKNKSPNGFFWFKQIQLKKKIDNEYHDIKTFELRLPEKKINQIKLFK